MFTETKILSKNSRLLTYNWFLIYYLEIINLPRIKNEKGHCYVQISAKKVNKTLLNEMYGDPHTDH